MQVNRLTLTNVRVFDQAELTFQPGMNLLVGINGAGKTTVLDVLRIMLSKQMHRFAQGRAKRLKFEDDYISVGEPTFEIEMSFTVGQVPFKHNLKRDRGASESRGELSPPYNAAIQREVQQQGINPVAIFFSTSRFLPDMKKPKAAVADTRSAAAYVDALVSRPLRLQEFAEWLRTLRGNETDENRQLLEALNEAVRVFLNGYDNLRAAGNPVQLLIDKGDKTLNVRQLSDGERSVLVLVLDVAKRLSLANLGKPDPLNGFGVVLIDEIGIHLHPSWERKIVERLRRTFPNCQFIATTHSPQIIGEVPAEQILLIKEDGIERPSQSLGMDSGWILRHLMAVSELNEAIAQKLDEIEALIERSELSQAKAVIRELKPRISDSPELARLQTRIDVFEMLGGNRG